MSQPVMRCHFDGACEPKNPGGDMGIGAYAAYLLWLYEQVWFLRSTSMDKIELQNYIRENKHVLEFQIKK